MATGAPPSGSSHSLKDLPRSRDPCFLAGGLLSLGAFVPGTWRLRTAHRALAEPLTLGPVAVAVWERGLMDQGSSTLTALSS